MVDNDLEKLSVLEISKIKPEELNPIIDNYNREQLENLFQRTKDEILKNRAFRDIESKINEADSKAHPINSRASNILSKITAKSAFRDLKAARNIISLCKLLICIGDKLHEEIKKEVNSELEKFGKNKEKTLRKTLGVFLGYIRKIGAKNKLKEYDIPCSIEIQCKEEFNKTFEFTMKPPEVVEEILKFAGVITAGSSLPQGIVKLVQKYGKASTRKAISSLYGAAKNNATYAWIGRLVCRGGGGIAAGKAALTKLGPAAVIIGTIISSTTAASSYSAKKLTEAVDYEKGVFEHITEMEKCWEQIKLVYNRISEVQEVMKQLENRIEEIMELFEPLVPDFDFNIDYHLKIFNKTGGLIKTISELANAPILSKDGNELLSSDIQKIIIKSRQITNEELING